MRAGAFGLSLLADPLDTRILLALEPGSLSLNDLRRAVGAPPQTTLRKRLRRFDDLAVLTRNRKPGFPGEVTYELGPAGPDLLDAAAALSAWLATSPHGPLAIGETAAKHAIKALIGGWTSNILRALAVRPLSLTELDRLMSGVNYPALERRLAAMRAVGQIFPTQDRARGTPYRVTRWLRLAIGPLLTAAEWERRWAGDKAELLGRLEVEAAFLLAVPLLRLPPSIQGSCRLVVEILDGKERTQAGVVVAIDDGRPTACRSAEGAEVESWATGSTEAWLRALALGNAGELDLGGESAIALAMVNGLCGALNSSIPRTRKAVEQHLQGKVSLQPGPAGGFHCQVLTDP